MYRPSVLQVGNFGACRGSLFTVQASLGLGTGKTGRIVFPCLRILGSVLIARETAKLRLENEDLERGVSGGRGDRELNEYLVYQLADGAWRRIFEFG